MQFRIEGASGAQIVSVAADSSGTASFSYVGSAEGTDTVLATTSLAGQPYSSNTANVSWAVPPLPPVTESRYEPYIYRTRFAQHGRLAGRSGKAGPVVLSIGAARATGQLLFADRSIGGGLRSYREILESMKAFSNGYHNGWQAANAGNIVIVWGANNVLPKSWDSNLSAARVAGARFAQAVIDYEEWIRGPHGPSPEYPGQVVRYNRQSAMAGFDIEEDPSEGWSDYPATRAFLEGYSSVPGARPIVNYGALTVAPSCESTSCAYGTSWIARNFLDVTRPPLVDFSCPQVYTNGQIDNWTGLEAKTGAGGDYGGRPIYFSCLFNSQPSPPFLTPLQSWRRFWGKLGTQFRTAWFDRRVTWTKSLAQSD